MIQYGGDGTVFISVVNRCGLEEAKKSVKTPVNDLLSWLSVIV